MAFTRLELSPVSLRDFLIHGVRRYHTEEGLDPAGKGVRLFCKRKVTTFFEHSELCTRNGSVHLTGEDGCDVHVEAPSDNQCGKTKLRELGS